MPCSQDTYSVPSLSGASDWNEPDRHRFCWASCICPGVEPNHALLAGCEHVMAEWMMMEGMMLG